MVEIYEIEAERAERVQKMIIDSYIGTLEESVESCNVIKTMKYIRGIDQLSNMDSLTRHGVDHLKSIDIHRQADEKVKELINKFDKKCICRWMTEDEKRLRIEQPI